MMPFHPYVKGDRVSYLNRWGDAPRLGTVDSLTTHQHVWIKWDIPNGVPVTYTDDYARITLIQSVDEQFDLGDI